MNHSYPSPIKQWVTLKRTLGREREFSLPLRYDKSLVTLNGIIPVTKALNIVKTVFIFFIPGSPAVVIFIWAVVKAIYENKQYVSFS